MKERSMSRVVGGRRYDTEAAQLVAHDAYWDGRNFERGGRNTYLYKTRKGAFFVTRLTQWQGERDTLEPVTRAEAMELYEGPLTEHEMTYEAAFDVTPGEPEGERPAGGGAGICLGWLELTRRGDVDPAEGVCLLCSGDLQGGAWLAAMADGAGGAELSGPYCERCATTE